MAFGVGVRAYDPNAPFGSQNQTSDQLHAQNIAAGKVRKAAKPAASATVKAKPMAPVAPAASVPEPTGAVPNVAPAPDTPASMQSLQSVAAPQGGASFQAGAPTYLRSGLGYRTPPSLAALLSGLRY